MLGAILTLLGFELIGELVRSALHLPIPGPVVGMILLAVVLAVQARKKPPSELPEVTPLDTTAGVLLRHMGLLLIPAGVGIVAEADLLREEWLPIVGGLLGSPSSKPPPCTLQSQGHQRCARRWIDDIHC